MNPALALDILSARATKVSLINESAGLRSVAFPLTTDVNHRRFGVVLDREIRHESAQCFLIAGRLERAADR